MKTPKEKAIELVEKYNNIIFCNTGTYGIQTAKQCALIAVDEILNQFSSIYQSLLDNKIINGNVKESANYIFYQQVKTEIEKL